MTFFFAISEPRNTAFLKKFKDLGGNVAKLEDHEQLLSIAKEFQNKYASQDEYIKKFVEKAREIQAK